MLTHDSKYSLQTIIDLGLQTPFPDSGSGSLSSLGSQTAIVCVEQMMNSHYYVKIKPVIAGFIYCLVKIISLGNGSGL